MSAGVLSLAAGAGGHVDGRAEAADVARKISMCQVAEYGYF